MNIEIPKTTETDDIFDYGFDKNLIRVAEQDSKTASEKTAVYNSLTDSVSASLITSGDLKSEITMIDGHLQSANYVAGTTGWRMDADGNLDANTGTFRGDITIGTGNNVFKADSNGIYLGDATYASAPFRVSMAGALSASSVNVSGAITTGVGSDIKGEYIESLSVSKLTTGEIKSKQITLSFTEGAGDCKIQAGKTDFGQYTTDGFILGIDDSDDNQTKFELTGGEIFGSIVNFFFGRGIDGTKTLNGTAEIIDITKSGNTYILERDFYFNDLTIDSGITLITNGYAIYCIGTLTNNGTIHNNGSNGSDGANANKDELTPPGLQSGGAGGAGGGEVGSTFGQAPSGGAGGDSNIGLDGYEDATTNGDSGTAKNPSLGSSGTNGGNGAGFYRDSTYYAGQRGTGGTGGTATYETLQFQPKSTEYTGSNFFNVNTATLFTPYGTTSKSTLSHSASAGGGGAGAGGMYDSSSPHYFINGGTGGGGGGTGGIVFIAAKKLINNGTIQSLGGNGGKGGQGNSWPGLWSSGRGGGGAGGTGGVIIIIYDSGSPGSFSAGNVAGGTGGAKGVGGSGGGPSYPAEDGATGGTGKYYIFHLLK